MNSLNANLLIQFLTYLTQGFVLKVYKCFLWALSYLLLLQHSLLWQILLHYIFLLLIDETPAYLPIEKYSYFEPIIATFLYISEVIGGVVPKILNELLSLLPKNAP